MTLILTFSFIISFSLSFILATSPIAMGLWVLMIALSTAVFTTLVLNKWLSFLIFLIYIGGLLVMFAYFSAISPNQQLEMFNLSSNMTFTLILMLLIFLLLPIFLSTSSTLHIQQPMTQLLFSPNILILVFMALVLFFALIAVVKISFLSQGPLRPFFYV